MLVSPAELVAVAKGSIKECSVLDVERCMGMDTVLIDIREPAEFRKCHIPGALHLPRGLLEFEIHAAVDRARSDENAPMEDTPIVLYCGTGGRSALAAQSLESMGYKNVRSMAGGIVAWMTRQLPVESSDA